MLQRRVIIEKAPVVGAEVDVESRPCVATWAGPAEAVGPRDERRKRNPRIGVQGDRQEGGICGLGEAYAALFQEYR